MRVFKKKKNQAFWIVLACLTASVTAAPMPLHAQEMQLKLPELNLPRPIDEQQSADETLKNEQDKAVELNQATPPVEKEPIKEEPKVPETSVEKTPEVENLPVKHDEEKPNTIQDTVGSSQTVQEMNSSEQQGSETPKSEAPKEVQSNSVPVEIESTEQEKPQDSTIQSLPVTESEQAKPTLPETNEKTPLEADQVKNDETMLPQNGDVAKSENNQPIDNENTPVAPNEEDHANGVNLLEDPQDAENSPVLEIIDAIVRERNPALKIDASRNDIFRFVSVERKGSTLLYKAAAPSLVTTPEWDGLTMTSIMCKEKRLRPYILDGKAAIKIEMNVVNPAGDYTFLADAHSCKQFTPEEENLNQAIEEPDLVALTLAAEAKRLSLFGCLKNSSTEMLENCTLGMVPRTSWEWQLQDVKTDNRKVIMTYLYNGGTVDEEEIRRVINRTCAKEELHSVIQLGVVYDIIVSGKANKEFLIDKQACDQI